VSEPRTTLGAVAAVTLAAVTLASVTVATAALTTIAAAAATAAAAAATPATPATVALSGRFGWSSDATLSCSGQRPGSVICVTAAGDVPGLGHITYVRDAVSTGGTTTDGCPQYTTEGTIWLDGGSATFTGRPAATCGGSDSPDAHYLVTFGGGTGTWADVSGSGEIVADKGYDIWTATVAAPTTATAGTGAASHGHSAAQLVAVSAGAAAAVLVAAGALVLGRRRRALRARRIPVD
jgi:hypothetical protein